MAKKQDAVESATTEMTKEDTVNATTDATQVESSTAAEATAKDLSKEQLAYAKKLLKDTGLSAVYVVGNLFFQDKKYADGRSAASGKPVITVNK